MQAWADALLVPTERDKCMQQLMQSSLGGHNNSGRDSSPLPKLPRAMLARGLRQARLQISAQSRRDLGAISVDPLAHGRGTTRPTSAIFIGELGGRGRARRV